ncbi:hypothetical protein ACOMHN_017362 [Nucella lapillus]
MANRQTQGNAGAQQQAPPQHHSETRQRLHSAVEESPGEALGTAEPPATCPQQGSGQSSPQVLHQSSAETRECRIMTSHVSLWSVSDSVINGSSYWTKWSKRCWAKGAAPEDIWTPFIQQHYPHLLSQTYCLPPIFFYRTPQTVETIAGQTVLVRDNPSSSGTGQQQPAPPPAQDSDWQGDTAHDRCLQALSGMQNEVMFIISSLRFQNYLHNPANPLHAAAIAQLPSIDDPSIPQNLRNGECDLIIIHRTYGLLIGEIKPVGRNDFFRKQTPDKQTQIITDKIRKAVKQLENQHRALSHLVRDLPPIRISMTLLLPNVSSSQLQSALSASPSLLQGLDVRHCLCQENLAQLLTWWQTLNTAPDESMTDYRYRRLVARFCGPASTVTIPTAGSPRKVVRTLGEATAETGLRYSSIALTPAQVALLNSQPEPQFVHLQGPPGTAKTVVLLLKALQWVRQGRQVVVVSGDVRSRAVTRLVEAQLRSMEPAAAANIQRLCYDFSDDGFSAGAAVARLQRHIRPGPVLIIFDEAGYSNHYLPFLTEIRDQLPAVSVWGASVRRLEVSLSGPVPSWLEVRSLQEALRCPPSVTAVVGRTGDIQDNDVLPYSAPRHSEATHGPPVQRRRHRGQPGHSGDHPEECDVCSDDVFQFLTMELRVGQTGPALQYRDVIILCRDVPRADVAMVRRLRQGGVPVRVTSDPPSPDDVEELALAVTDVVMVTDWRYVTGLERRVVVVLGTARSGWNLEAMSRCSGCLYTIDCEDP